MPNPETGFSAEMPKKQGAHWLPLMVQKLAMPSDIALSLGNRFWISIKTIYGNYLFTHHAFINPAFAVWCLYLQKSASFFTHI